ncbi:hypothetical protein, partial [Enterobacter sp. 56-7]|uniref:hypothetical protein n=1 Tax=Enterobacter sp. 56-7 TaxID=1895906 RepID=UPI002579B77E
MAEASKRGLAVIIYRPGFISWSATACNPQDWVTRLIRSVLVSGVYSGSLVLTLFELCRNFASFPRRSHITRSTCVLSTTAAAQLSRSVCANRLRPATPRQRHCLASSTSSTIQGQFFSLQLLKTSVCRDVSFAKLVSWLESHSSQLALSAVTHSAWCNLLRHSPSNPLFTLLPQFESSFPQAPLFDDAAT